MKKKTLALASGGMVLGVVVTLGVLLGFERFAVIEVSSNLVFTGPDETPRLADFALVVDSGEKILWSAIGGVPSHPDRAPGSLSDLRGLSWSGMPPAEIGQRRTSIPSSMHSAQREDQGYSLVLITSYSTRWLGLTRIEARQHWIPAARLPARGGRLEIELDFDSFEELPFR